MPNVLFVCTANRYRSPIAAACFEQELQLRGLTQKWSTGSAGTWAIDGMPPMSGAVAAARRLGLDITAHKSKIVSAGTLGAADLILVMELGHKEALSLEFPSCSANIRLLTEVTGGHPYSIPDPASTRIAGEVSAEIQELVHAGFERICALADQRCNARVQANSKSSQD